MPTGCLAVASYRFDEGQGSDTQSSIQKPVITRPNYLEPAALDARTDALLRLLRVSLVQRRHGSYLSFWQTWRKSNTTKPLGARKLLPSILNPKPSILNPKPLNSEQRIASQSSRPFPTSPRRSQGPQCKLNSPRFRASSGLGFRV